MTNIGTALATLLAVIVGAFLAWKYEHRRSLFDHRMKEYRELLDGLFQSTEKIINSRPKLDTPLSDDLGDAVWNGHRLIQNRLFIAKSIRDEKVQEDWDAISGLALWQPGEPKIKIKGQDWQYMQNAIANLRRELQEKLIRRAHKDLRIG